MMVDDEPAAMVCGWGERWAKGWTFLIKEMCVHLSHRRAGLGMELVENFENMLIKNDSIGAYLETLDEGPSIEFYSSLTF